MESRRVAMLLYGAIDHDARVIREATTLREDGNDVVVYSLADAGSPGNLPFESRPVRPGRGVVPGAASPFREQKLGWLGRLGARIRWLIGYGASFGGWLRAVGRVATPADVWHGHDLFGLMAASWLARRHGGVVVYDSHELFLEAGSAARLPQLIRRVLGRVEGHLARRAAVVITVNRSIARELASRYRVRPVVVMNCPPLPELDQPPRLRRALGLPAGRIVMYHGALNPGRGVEELVDAIPSIVGNAVVVLLGDGDLAPRYVEQAGARPNDARLYVHPAVPVDELPAWISEADVGVIAFQPIDRNNRYGTPNKLFEYLSVGVPVVVSDFPEMASIVCDAGVGETCDPTRPDSIAVGVNLLLSEPDEERASRRFRARALAETRFNWAVESLALRRAYDSIASLPATVPE